MSIIGSNILAGASGGSGAATGYQIERSLRFNSADSADLRKTFSSAGNSKTFTISFWVKRSKLGAYQRIFATYPPQEYIRFENTDKLRIFESFATLTTTQLFRDPSSFYHIVIAADSTQTTASDRLKLYVNGTQVTQFSTATYPSQNATCHFFTAVPHQIGSGTVEYLNGYLADVHFIDGQQLAPTDFGEFDNNNVWQPKEYSGSYGTNGFYLKFDDNSSNAALGTDSSGNSNSFTVNNLTAESPTSLPGVDFDGSGDYLSIPASADNNFGTGDFTMEWYKKWTTLTGYQTIWSNNYTSGLLLQTASGTGKYRVYVAGSQLFAETNAPDAGRWYHYALVRNGNTFTIYRDGVANGSATSSASVGNSSDVATIGQGSTNYENGVISNFRVVKGTAVYTSSFTRPTTPLTNITNTVLLCCQSDSSATAAAVSPGTITANGNPTAVTFSDSTEANDCLVDTPTNFGEDTGVGGSIRGNYATLNPFDYNKNGTLSDGNLRYANTVTSHRLVRSNFPMKTGKWYCEVTVVGNANTVGGSIGIATKSASISSFCGNTGSHGYHFNGYRYNNGPAVAFGTAYGAILGSVVGLAYDADAGKLEAYFNGVLVGTVQDNLTDEYYFAASTYNCILAFNFGARSFSYPAPSGYKEICTTNLPEATIPDGSNHFDVIAYTGNGSTKTISGLGFSPDLVWYKSRVSGYHFLVDTIRGVNKSLHTNATDAELNQTGLTAFNSDGFTLGPNTSIGNTNNEEYVAWAWDAGANSSKTYTVTVVSESGNKYRFDGHGTSAVTLDLEEGSTYTFDQSDSTNAGHPLRFSTTADGTHGSGSEYTTGVVTSGTPGAAGAYTKITIAASAPVLYYYCTQHSGMGGQINTNSTAGATVLSGSLNDDLYDQSQTWSNNAVTTGNSGNWSNVTNLFDGNLSTYAHANINASVVTVTLTFSPPLPVTSGVKVWGGMTNNNVIWRVNNETNASFNSANYNSVENFYSFSGNVSTITIGNSDGTNNASGLYLYGVEVDGKLLINPSVSVTVPSMNSVVRANPAAGFSIVSYTGSSSAATLGHGLNAAPGMIIVKDRDSGSWNWQVAHSGIGADDSLLLNATSAKADYNAWNNTRPTSSVFSLGGGIAGVSTNGSAHIAYCLAPVSGFSSIGSYLGNGSATDGTFVWTGFKPKLVILKNTSSSASTGSDWLMIDTARDPYNNADNYLIANGNNAEGVTTVMDVLSNGFKLTNAYTSTNGSGIDYIYMAFASNPFSLNGGMAR